MDLVPPVRSGDFPDKRSARKAEGEDRNPFARSFAPARPFGRARSGAMSLKPAAPLANIPMLLEILSETGAPANRIGNVRSLHRRREDVREEQAGKQYSFDFGE